MGSNVNLPISMYMTFSDSSAFAVEVRLVEDIVDLIFSANCKRKTNTCLYTSLSFLGGKYTAP